MPFSSGDKVLINNQYRFKKYSFWRILTEFLKINCNKERVAVNAMNRDFGNMQHRPKTSRLKHTHTEGNVIIVDEMVGLLHHKGQKQKYRSIRQISKEMDLTKYSIVQIIYCILVGSVFC